MLEEFRNNIINMMCAVKTDPCLNNKEKDKKIIELARRLGKACLEHSFPEDFKNYNLKEVPTD